MADVKPLILDSGTIKQIATGDTLGVANGGTGATTLTDNGVLIGNGTSAITATAEGATGEVLVGVTGGNPVFSSSYIGKSVAVYKSADESVTSSTSLQNDNEISLPIGSNETWKGVLLLVAEANASGGMKYDFTLPSGASGSMKGTGDSDISCNSQSMTSAVGGTGTILATALFTLAFSVVNSSTAGTVQFRFAQNTSFGTSTTVKAGSILTATRTA